MLSWIDELPPGLSDLIQLSALVSFMAVTAGALIVHGDVARRRRRTGLIAVGASTAVVLVHAPWLAFFGPSAVAALIALVIVLFQWPGQVLDALLALLLLATPVAFAAVHLCDALRSMRVLRRPALGFRDAAWLLAGLGGTYIAGQVSFAAAWSFAR
jgi:hypothetical protein